MKTSIELTRGKRFKKILLSNDLEDFEHPDKNCNTSLSQGQTERISKDKKDSFSNEETYNPTTKDYLETKKGNYLSNNELSSERKDNERTDKKDQVKKTKILKDKNKNTNKKKIYIKKKKIVTLRKEIKKDYENKVNNNNNDNKQIQKIIEDSDKEQKEIIKEIKDSVTCYICLMKIKSPRICPNCHKLACEDCLKNWFIDKGNNNCGYCRAKLSFDNMISFPIINDVANLIDKISSKKPKNQIGMNYTRSKRIKKNYKYLSDISNDKNDNSNSNEIINDDNIVIQSINVDNFLNSKNKKNNEIYFDKKHSIISHSTHGPLIKKIENEYNNSIEEYCPKHYDQPLFYYCLECNRAYCRTCFVFFGDEKDKHNNHNIIKYEKYKSMNYEKIKKIAYNLDSKYEEIIAYIKRCEALKSCYEYERNLVQTHIKQLMDKFNSKVDESISILDNIIKKYKFNLGQIEKGKNDINNYYMRREDLKSKIYIEDLIDKLSNILKNKYYNSKEVDGFSELSKNISLNFYQSKLKKCEIKHNNYHFKIPFDNSKYQMAITQKGNEVQIYMYWPINNDINDKENENKNILPIVFLRRKNKNWEYFQLDEYLEFKGNNYLIKRFPADNFSNINSYPQSPLFFK